MNMSRWLKKRMGVLFLLCSATAMFLAGAAQAGPKEDRLALQLKKLQHAEAKLEREIRQLRRGPAGGGKMMDLAVPQQNDVKELLRLADRRTADRAAELNSQLRNNLLAEKSKELNRVKAARKKLEGTGKQAAPVSGARRAARVEDGTGSISGRITNAEGVGLAASAYVYSVDYEWDYYASALTDADGNYTVSGLPAGSYKVEFSAHDETHFNEWFNNKTSFDAADVVAVTSGVTVSGINAELEVGGSISGKMTKTAGGSLAGSVHVYSADDEWEPYAFTLVDADGNYTVTGLAAGRYKVKFAADDATYEWEWYNDKASFDAADEISVALGSTVSGINASLAQSGSISGRMTDASENGLAGEVLVYDLGYEAVGYASTDADGNYTVSGLRAGSYKVEFEAENEYFISQWYKGSSTFACAEEVAVTSGGTTANINAKLAAGGAVSGKMTDAAGKRITGSVNVYDLDQNWAGSDYVWTEDGSYTVSGLPAGSYKVEFSPDDGQHLGQWYNGRTSFAAADAVAVNVSKTTPDINATLAQGGSISGTMTDAAEENGLAGEVTVYDENHGWVDSIWTEDGSYTVSGLATGSYKVEFNADGNYVSEWHNDKGSFATADAVAVTAPNTTANINAALAQGGSISGTMTDAEGNGLAGDITVYDENHGWVNSIWTEDGSYTVSGLKAGSYKVAFHPDDQRYEYEWYNDKDAFNTANAVTVTSGSDTASVNATLAKGGSISGKMTDTTGAGVAGHVYAYAFDGSWAAWTWTGSDGSYTLSGLRTGRYKVLFAPNNSDDWLTCGSSKPYVTEWYNNKRSFNAADPVQVTAPSVTTGIDAEVSTEPLPRKALLPILNLVL